MASIYELDAFITMNETDDLMVDTTEYQWAQK
jgi:hypothetical protein